MIPPPPDRALPDLAIAFNGEAMAGILARRLPDCADDRFLVHACRPVYVRYKPETRCLVQYAVDLLDVARGAELATTLHVVLHPGDQARRVVDRPSVARYAERAARHHPDGPRRRAAWLPEIGALGLLFPVDRHLPSLSRLASPGKMRRGLPRMLASADAAMPVDASALTTAVELVRYKPGRKALLRFRLATEPGETTVYGKVYADPAVAARVHDVGRALAAASVATPAPLAHVPALAFVLQPEVPGTVLRALRGQPSFAAAMPAVVDLLAGFHAAGARAAAAPASAGVFGRADPLGSARASGRLVAAILPHLAGRVERLARALASRLGDAAPAAQALVHGDFYDDQVLLDRGRATLLDLDEAAVGHPSIDVANLLATIAVWEGDDAQRAGGAARAALVDAWMERGPSDGGDLAAFEAAALVSLCVAPFRQMAVDWPAAVEGRLALAEARLAHGSTITPQGPRRAPRARRGPRLDDPALPQLAELFDPERMAAAFAGLGAVADGAVRVDGITVARHKPGRRCVIRYDVTLDPPGRSGDPRRETWFGKTFASRRGGRVHAVHAAVAAAMAPGPGIRLAEPLGYLPELDLAVQRAVAGQSADVSLARGDIRLAEQVAEALHALHASGLALPRTHGLEQELAPLAGRVDRLCAGCPPLAITARRCLAQIMEGPPAGTAWRRRPIHRDFYHDQVLVDGDGTPVVLDFDDAAMSEPAVDVANFVAHLKLLAAQRPTAGGAIQASAAAFVARYRALDAGMDPALLRFLEGATLLRLAEIHHARADGRRLAAAMAAESAACLGLRLNTSLISTCAA